MKNGHGHQDRKRLQPQVEGLESRLPLSGGAGAGAVGAHEVRATQVALAQGLSLPLQGTVRGAYFASSGIPDTGSSYRISGAGRVNPLGQTGDTARIQTTGFIANGRATGTMSIVAPRGTVKLALAGP